jgi:hypothetical protein
METRTIEEVKIYVINLTPIDVSSMYSMCMDMGVPGDLISGTMPLYSGHFTHDDIARFSMPVIMGFDYDEVVKKYNNDLIHNDTVRRPDFTNNFYDLNSMNYVAPMFGRYFGAHYFKIGSPFYNFRPCKSLELRDDNKEPGIYSIWCPEYSLHNLTDKFMFVGGNYGDTN